MTLWFEGEVWLEANSTEMFELNGDDVSFFQIAPPGTTAYGPVSDSNNNAVPVATPTTGWYPIRIGHANGNSGNNIEFTHSDLGVPLSPWTRERLRARTSEMGGMLRTVFGNRLLGGGEGSQPPVSHFDDGGLLAQTTFSPVPQGTTSNDNWSARYLGQVYIDQAGTYTLKVDSDDGNRVRLGTQRGQINWGQNGRPGMTSVPATLDPGWNDLLVDYDQTTGNRSLRVQLTRPDATTMEIPRDQLRPVESADDRLVSSSDDTPHDITDNGGAGNPGTGQIPVAGYAGEMVTSIDVTFFVTSSQSDQLRAELETPGGIRVPIRGHGNIDPTQGAQVTILATATDATATLLRGAATGTWKLHVFDDVANGGDSQLQSAKLTLHTTGGPEKIAKTASWTSQILDAQTHVIAIDSVTWDDRLQAGAGVEVRVGTCQQADCSDVTWSGAVAKATAFAVGPARYLQLRVDMTSNGSLEPELRSLSVMYRRDPG
jgi:subtilisin-like proprotein convertase family protein